VSNLDLVTLDHALDMLILLALALAVARRRL